MVGGPKQQALKLQVTQVFGVEIARPLKFWFENNGSKLDLELPNATAPIPHFPIFTYFI